VQRKKVPSRHPNTKGTKEERGGAIIRTGSTNNGGKIGIWGRKRRRGPWREKFLSVGWSGNGLPLRKNRKENQSEGPGGLKTKKKKGKCAGHNDIES